MRKQAERSIRQIIIKLLFLAYCGLMIWLLLGQRMETGAAENNWNLIPFDTLRLYCRMLRKSDNCYLQRHAFVNLVGNVVMFIPFGYFLAAIWEKLYPFFACLLCTLSVIVVIEVVQYLTGLGSCDVDDLILNLPGTMIGWGICRLFTKKRL